MSRNALSSAVSELPFADLSDLRHLPVASCQSRRSYLLLHGQDLALRCASSALQRLFGKQRFWAWLRDVHQQWERPTPAVVVVVPFYHYMFCFCTCVEVLSAKVRGKIYPFDMRIRLIVIYHISFVFIWLYFTALFCDSELLSRRSLPNWPNSCALMIRGLQHARTCATFISWRNQPLELIWEPPTLVWVCGSTVKLKSLPMTKVIE